MSDQTTSIFKESTTPVVENKAVEQTPASTANTNAYTDLLKQIVNEKGEQKYSTIEDALVGLKHAQDFIPKLKEEKRKEEEELEMLRKEMQRLAYLEDTVTQLTEKQKESHTQTTPTLTEADIATLVQQTLTKTQQAELQKRNISTVVEKITAQFGDQAEKVFYEKANEMGMTVEEMNALAAKTPKAVLTMLGVSDAGAHKQPKFSPTSSSVNTTALAPKPNSLIGKSQKNIMVGATTRDVMEESANARGLVEELHSQGMSINDLTNPKVYFKLFG